jgi:hypothetical protein
MTNKPRKDIPKAARLNQLPPGVTKKMVKKKPKRSQSFGWLWSSLALTLLLSSAGAIIGFGWISVLYILNPAQVNWVNEFLPSWAKISTGKREIPETFTAIQLGLSQKQRLAGENISLDGKSEDSFLLPIFQERTNCQSNCQEFNVPRI